MRVRALFLEWKLSNHCSAAQHRDIMVARRASFRQGAPENRMLGVFAASRLAYASIVPYHSDTSAQLKRMCFAVIITTWHLNGNSRNQVGQA